MVGFNRWVRMEMQAERRGGKEFGADALVWKAKRLKRRSRLRDHSFRAAEKRLIHGREIDNAVRESANTQIETPSPRRA